MKKRNLFPFVFLTIVFLLVICFGSNIALATTAASVADVDQQLIKNVVNNYFEKRYQSQKNLKLADFSSLIAISPMVDDMKKEMEKLDLEVYHSKVFQLQIQKYQFYLDFGEMTFDPVSLTATVKVTEGCDVIYAIEAPTPSKMRNLSHIILLKKENGIWKISGDKYEDPLWKFLKGNSLTDVEIRTQFDNAANQYTKSMSALSTTGLNTLESVANCTFRGVNVCYDRQGAVNYADTYALVSNPYFYYYLGFDCTNFVSQAMNWGGGISQVLSAEAQATYGGWDDSKGYPQGTSFWTGFYYYNFWIFWQGQEILLFNHSPSWTSVDDLYYFLVPRPTDPHFHYLGGPMAWDISDDLSKLQIGDLIQFDWVNGGPGFDHTVIVDDIQNGNIYIDSHSPDLNHYLLSLFLYYNTTNEIRYIHILDRLQILNYIPLASNSGPYPNIATQPLNQAYPAPPINSPLSNPTELTTPRPYPAP